MSDKDLHASKANHLRIDLTEPYQKTPIETDALGRVFARRPTMAMANAFCARMKDAESDDFTVARTFMGCATGRPTGDSKSVTQPLSEAEISKLSDDDVRRFAATYLAEILGEREPAADPIARIADHARGQLAQYQESRRKFAEVVANSLRPIQSMYKDVFETAKQMQSWSQLAAQQGAIADALKPNPLRIGETLRKLDPLASTQRDDIFARPKPIDLSALRPPPVEKTPGGRTMMAAESASAAVARIEDAIGVIVTQAGNVSELIAGVIKEIEDQSGKMQDRTEKQTTRAMRYARWSLAISALALIVSAAFNALTYIQGRSATQESAQDARELVVQSQHQSESLAKLVERTPETSTRMPPTTRTSADVQKTTSAAPPIDHSKNHHD